MTTTKADKRLTFTAPVTLSAETRSVDGKLRLRGVAAVFNSMSEDLGFREVMLPGAFEQALTEGDPMLLWMHNPDQPLARRSAGNLELRETRDGLEFEAELPDTTLARDAVELVRAGVVKGMSFAFDMVGGMDRWEERDGEPWRFIKRIGKLFEISLVSEPAYAATSVDARERKIAEVRARGPLRIRERSRYGARSEFSYFRDLAMVHAAEARKTIAIDKSLPSLQRFEEGSLPPHPVHGSLEDARRRLAIASEYRDVSTSDPGGASFLPGGSVPAFVGMEFATALRTRAVLPGVIRVEPLPESGLKVETPRIATATSAAIQASEASAASETDLDSDTVTSPVVTIAAQQDMSDQLFERSSGGTMDIYLATELGEALAAVLDAQIISGSGSSGQLRGILNVSGVTAVTKTNGSPTAVTNYAAIGDLVKQASDAYGGMVDTLVMAPRRLAFIKSKLGYVPEWLGLRAVASSAVPTNLGASTNEDRIIALPGQEIILHVDPPSFGVFPDVLSGTMETRYQARLYAALLAGRKPAAIGVMSGTELTSVTF